MAKEKEEKPKKKLPNFSKTEASVEKEEAVAPEADEVASGYIQWAVNENGSYIPTFKTTQKVPPGVYEISHNPNVGYYLIKQKVVMSDTVLELPIKEPMEILADIEDFWKLKDQFRKYKMVYKRGILMHGPPGCGKSYLIQTLTNKIVEKGGIVFSLNSEAKVDHFISFCQIFRQIEPDRPLLVIIEDIDNIVSQGHGLLSALLNVLDGVNQIDNVVYLATTNYPEKLQERIANRPSRFDRMYEISLPDDETREFFIKAKLAPDDLKKIDMEKWVELTDGLTLSHIKEIVVSTMIFGKKIEDVCAHFDTMKRPKNSRTHHGKPGVGFDTPKKEEKKVGLGN